MKNLEIYPLTPGRWTDFVQLFGKNGACAGCWCMWWRLPRTQWLEQRGAGNKRAIRRVVRAGPPPGLLAYVNGEPAGWCVIAPRADYPVLARSRVLKPVDGQPVWSVTCFFVARPFRRRGLTIHLLRAAAQSARQQGGKIVEGYPKDAASDQADAFVYTGLASAFHKAGFREVARRSPTRPVFRRRLRATRDRSEKTLRGRRR